MAKKKIRGNKTDRFINLVLEISRRANFEVNEAVFKELLGNPSKSQFYAYLQDLTFETGERPALISRVSRDGQYFYRLHNKTWENFFVASYEGDFLLEIHRKLGFLFECGLKDTDFFDEGSTSKDFDRKFFYLSAIKGKGFSKEAKTNLHVISKALISNNKLEIVYSGSLYSIFPLGLCQYRDEVYLLSFSETMKKESFRVFKMARLEKAQLTDETFKYPAKKDWDPNEYFKGASGIVVKEGRKALFRVYGKARKLVKEKDFFNASLVSEAKEYDQYECFYTNDQEFIGQLFVYADEIELLGPDDLIVTFIEKLNASMELHKSYLKNIAG